MLFLSPRHRFLRRLRTRERYAYVIQEDLALQRELPKHRDLASKAVMACKDDEVLYERALGLPPAPELRAALHQELLLWLSIRDQLTSMAGRDQLPASYRREVAELLPRLHDLLHLQTISRTLLERPLKAIEALHLQDILERYR